MHTHNLNRFPEHNLILELAHGNLKPIFKEQWDVFAEGKRVLISTMLAKLLSHQDVLDMANEFSLLRTRGKSLLPVVLQIGEVKIWAIETKSMITFTVAPEETSS